MGSVDATQWVLLAIALLNAVTAFWAYKSRVDLKEIKHATNSMKDDLVKVTAKEQFAAGKEEERVASIVRDAEIAKAILGTVPGQAPADYTPDKEDGGDLIITAEGAKVETKP